MAQDTTALQASATKQSAGKSTKSKSTASEVKKGGSSKRKRDADATVDIYASVPSSRAVTPARGRPTRFRSSVSNTLDTGPSEKDQEAKSSIVKMPPASGQQTKKEKSIKGTSGAVINLGNLNLPSDVLAMLGGQQTQSDINLAKIRHSHASTSALTLDVDPTQIPILQSNTQATPTRSTRPTKTYGKKQQNERDSGPAQEESASATQTQDAPLGMQAKSKDGKSKVKKKESQKQKHKSSAPSEELPASPPATTDDRPKKKAKVGRTKKPDPSNAEKEHETVAAVEKKTPVSDSNAVGSSTTVLDQVIAPNTPPSPQVQKFSSPRRRSIVPDSDEDELATQQPSHINPSTRPLLQVSAQDTDDTTSSSQQGEGSKKRRRKSKAGGSGVSNGSVNQPTRKPAEPPVPIEKPIPLQGRGKKRTRESDTQEQRSGKAKRNKHKSAREPEPQPEEEQEALPASQVDELLDSQTQQASTFHPKTGVDGSVQTAPEPPSRAPPSPKTLRVHSSVEDVGVQTDQPAVSPPPEQTTAVAFAPEQQQSTIAAVPVFTRPHIGISSTDLAARLGTPEGAESWSKMIEYEEEMNRLCQVWVEERQRLFGLFVSTTPADDAQREPLSNATTLPQPSASEQEQEPRPSLAPGTSLPAPLAAVSTSALTTTSAPAPTPAVSATVSQAEARSVPKATKGGQETSSSSSEDESSSDSESESEKRRGDKKQMFPSSRNSLHLPPPPRKSTKGDIPSKSSPMRALAQPKPAPAPRLSLGNLRVSLSSDEEEADEDDDDESDDEEEDRAQDQTLTALGSPEPEVAPKPRRSTQRARSPSSDWPSSPQSAERRPLDTAEPQPLADQTSASMPGDQTRSQSPSASDAVSVNEVDKEKQPTEEGSVEELQSTRSERSESLPPTEHHQNEHFSPSRFSDASLPLRTVVNNDVDERALEAASKATSPSPSQQPQSSPPRIVQLSDAEANATQVKAGKDSSLQAVSDSEAGEDFQPNGQTGAETTDHADALAANVVTDEDTETNNNTLTKSPSQSSNASAQVRDQLVTKSPIKTSSPSKETVSQQNDGEKLASPDRPSQAHPDSSPVKDVAEQPKTNGMPLFRPPSSDEQSKPNEMPLFHPASSDDNSSGSSSEADDLPLKQHPVTPKNRTPPSGVTARPSVSQSARPTLRSRPSTTHSLSDLLSMRRKSTAPAFPRPSISSSQVEKPSVISASQLVPSHLNDDESESESEDQNSSSEEEAPQDTVRRTRAKARATRLETQSQPIRNTRSAASRGRSPVKK